MECHSKTVVLRANLPMATEKGHLHRPRSEVQLKLGEVVRSYRHSLGLTQDELGWRANLHRTYIADVERGARNVTLKSILNLSKALQVTVGRLLSSLSTVAGEVGAAKERLAVDSSKEILLVEDNSEDVTLTQRAFRRARISNTVRVARDAEEAMGLLFPSARGSRPAMSKLGLILLDLNLPRMSGLQLLRRIKDSKATRDIPVVVLTVSYSDRMIIECGRLGAENYIVKPFGIESLIRLTPRLNLQLTLGPPSEPAG